MSEAMTNPPRPAAIRPAVDAQTQLIRLDTRLGIMFAVGLVAVLVAAALVI